MSSGVAVSECVRWNVLGDDRASSDDTVTSYAYLWADRNTATDAHVIADARTADGSRASHRILVIEKRCPRPDEDHIADLGCAGEIDMSHDLDATANSQSTLERTFVMNDAAVPDRHFAANQYLMATLEAIANGRVRINDRSGTNDGIVTDDQWR